VIQIPDFLKDTAGEWWVRPLTPSSSGNKKGFTRVIPLVLPRRANRGYHPCLWNEKKEKEDTLSRVNHIF
jgi:hypothetical protein